MNIDAHSRTLMNILGGFDWVCFGDLRMCRKNPGRRCALAPAWERGGFVLRILICGEESERGFGHRWGTDLHRCRGGATENTESTEEEIPNGFFALCPPCSLWLRVLNGAHVDPPIYSGALHVLARRSAALVDSSVGSREIFLFCDFARCRLMRMKAQRASYE